MEQEQEHHHRGYHRDGQHRPEQRRAGPPIPPRRAARAAWAARTAGSARSHRPIRDLGRQRGPRLLEGRLVRLRIERGRRRGLLVRGLLVRRRWVRRGRRGRLVGRGLEGRPGSGVRVPVTPVIRGGEAAAGPAPGPGRRGRPRRREPRARLGEPRTAALDGRGPGGRPGPEAACRRFLLDDALPALGTEPRTRAQLRPAPAAPAAELFHSTTAPALSTQGRRASSGCQGSAGHGKRGRWSSPTSTRCPTRAQPGAVRLAQWEKQIVGCTVGSVNSSSGFCLGLARRPSLRGLAGARGGKNSERELVRLGCAGQVEGGGSGTVFGRRRWRTPWSSGTSGEPWSPGPVRPTWAPKTTRSPWAEPPLPPREPAVHPSGQPSGTPTTSEAPSEEPSEALV